MVFCLELQESKFDHGLPIRRMSREYYLYDIGEHVRYINKKTGEVSTGVITEYLGGPTMHYVCTYLFGMVLKSSLL